MEAVYPKCELPFRLDSPRSDFQEFASGGDRLGWLTIPRGLEPLRDAMLALGSSTYSCANVTAQYAALAALQYDHEIEQFLALARQVYSTAGSFAAGAFRSHDIACFEPQAAWYLWLPFNKFREQLAARGITTSQQLTDALIRDVGAVFVAGSEFGMAPDDLWLRASTVDFDGPAAMEDCASK